MKKIIAIIMMTVLLFALTGCTLGTEADKVNHNLSKQAGYFECERRITVYNALSDKVIFTIEGYLDISNNSNHELVVTCQTGPKKYKKNYIYLNTFTLYAVEDITGTHADPYHYQMYVPTHLPVDFEMQP